MSKPIAAVMNSGDKFFVYRGKMTIYEYKIVEEGQERIAEKIQIIDLVKEIQASGKADF